MSDKIESIRSFIMAIAAIMFTASLFDAIYGFKTLINPGISLVYNAVGTRIEPNMVTLIVFDWRGFDTLGESLILVTAVLVVLLVFGRGKILDNKINAVETLGANGNNQAQDLEDNQTIANESIIEEEE